LQQQRQMQLQQQEMKKQQALEMQRKTEEMNRKRMEEQKKKAEELKRQQEENAAAMQVRRVIQKVRLAREDTLALLQQELAEIMQKELAKCGSVQAKVQEECKLCVEQGKANIEKLKEAKLKEEECKVELAKKLKENQEKAEVLVKELDEKVSEAEASVATLTKKAAPFLAAELPEKVEQIEQVSKAVDAAVAAANDKLQLCTDFVKEHRAAMSVPDTPGQGPSETKQLLAKLLQQLAEITKSKDSTIVSAANAKTKSMKKAVARKQLDTILAKFTKYDSNKDNVLDKAEVKKYAQGEFKFKVADDTLATIFKILVDDGSKGVKKADFHRLKMQIGIAREGAKDAERKNLRLKREKELETLRVGIKAEVSEADKNASAAEEVVKKVEELAQPLQAKGKSMTSIEILKLVDEVAGETKAAQEQVTSLKQSIAELKEGVEQDLKSWLAGETRSLDGKANRLEPRLARLNNLLARFREDAKKKDAAELMALERQAKAMLQHHKKAKSLSPDEVFAAISKKESVTQKDFLTFFEKKCEKEEPKEGAAPAPSQEDLGRLFKFLDEKGEGSVSKERLMLLIRTCMKVLKDGLITDGASIADGQTLRRLEVGEVVEVLSSPAADGDTEVMRAKCRATKDGVEGWVSISGNQGSVFLQEGGTVFKVVKEIIMTDSFELDSEDSKDVTKEPRKLRAGELIEVRVFESKEEKSGLVRLKCKAKSDGALGWVTIVGNAGTKFLEVV